MPDTTVDTGKTLGQIAKDILTTPPASEDTRNNGELLAEHGLRVMHFKPTEGYHHGMTVAFKTFGKNANVIEVATAIVHPSDTFTKKIGTRLAVEAFVGGRTTLLPVPSYLKGKSPVGTLLFYLG